MKLEFLDEAQTELFDAGNYYEDQEPGLGKQFRDEVWKVCSMILEHPVMWRERTGGFRRVNCPVFPYYIGYFIRGEIILIAAVAHARRDPNYWKQRLE